MNTKRDTILLTKRSPGQPATRRRRVRPAARRPDISPAAYQRLRDLVVTGRLAPGSPLIEADLSKRLGVSRTPIRAALQRLQQEGFVAASPVGQTLRPIVAPLTARDLSEVFVMVGAFEAMAARTAAEFEAGRREALASELELLTAAFEAAGRARPPDLRAAAELRARFHRLVAEVGAGPRLRGELDVLNPQVQRYVRAYDPACGALDEALAEQRAIVAALRDGDGDTAGQQVADHWRQSLERLKPVIAAVGEQGTW